MEIKEIFEQLGKRCTEGGCEECSARGFCHCTPTSITVDRINFTIIQMEFSKEQD